MSAHFVTIGRRKYAVGLYWENSAGGSPAQAAREAVRQSDKPSPLYVVRSGNKNGRVPQFGLVQEGPDLSAGMPVLAACLANQQPGSWAGAFRLREGTVLVIVRDDLILPDGDLFFEDENDARDRLVQEVGFGGLQRIYAPEAWGVPGSDTLPLSLLLNDYVGIRLQSTKISKNFLLGVGGGVLILCGVLGLGWYHQVQEEKAEALRLEQAQALEKARLAAQKMVPGASAVGAQQTPVYPPMERFWEKEPHAVDVIMNCKNALGKVKAVQAGWQMSSVRCDTSSMTIAWNRSSGYAAIPENAALSENGLTATQTISLPKLEVRGGEELLDHKSTLSLIYRYNWQLHDFSEPARDPAPLPPPGYTGVWNPPLTPWVKRSFTLKQAVLPWGLTDQLASFPGVIVKTLTYTPSGTKGAWAIEGVIYESR